MNKPEIVYCYWPTWQVPKIGDHVRMPHDSHSVYANRDGTVVTAKGRKLTVALNSLRGERA